MVTVDTPRTQALIGFVRSNEKSDSNLAARIDNNFCTILLTSLDEKPIAQSSRLLLVAGGRVENSGQQWNTAGTDVTAWGGAPTLIEQVKGTVTLRGFDGARSIDLQPLDGAGQPQGATTKATKSGDDWQLPLGKSVTTWYEITVER
jgi:hypothetical protein